MSNLENRIIKSLDNSPRFLFWDVGECMILVISFLTGGALESLTVVMLGISFWFLYRKFNQLAKKRSIIPFHFLYWNLPTKMLKRSGRFSSLPCSHKRNIIL